MTNPISLDKIRMLVITRLASLFVLVILPVVLFAAPLVSHAMPQRNAANPQPTDVAKFIFIFINNKDALTQLQPRDYKFEDLASRPVGTLVWTWYINRVAYARYLGGNKVAILLSRTIARQNPKVVANNVTLVKAPASEIQRYAGSSPTNHIPCYRGILAKC